MHEHAHAHMQVQQKNSATGTRTRVARVRAEYPNQLDYSGFCCGQPSESDHMICSCDCQASEAWPVTLVVRRGQARQDEAKPHQYFCKGPNASRGHQQKHAPLHFKNFKPQVFLSHLHEQVGHSISFLTGFDGWWQAGYSSVGRASDCRVCRDQMVPGSIPGGRICLLPCKHEKSKQML